MLESLSTTSTTATTSETMNEQTDIAQLLNGKVVSSLGSTDGKTSVSEDTILLPDGRTVTVREVTDLTKRKEPTDFGISTTATNN